VDDVHGLPANVVTHDLDTLSGYEILGHHLTFVGTCPQCRSQSETGRSRKPRMRNNAKCKRGSVGPKKPLGSRTRQLRYHGKDSRK
jgi:hypothetical protein